MEIDLARVPTAVDAIVVVGALDDTVSGSVADHGGGTVTVSGSPTVTGLTTERCVSQGFPDLARLISVFGIDTDDSA